MGQTALVCLWSCACGHVLVVPVLVDNIAVRFFETSEEGLVWEAFADFGQGDVHRQVRETIWYWLYR